MRLAEGLLSTDGEGNIFLRSTFSLQYGHVCFFPTMHHPLMQNSWKLVVVVAWWVGIDRWMSGLVWMGRLLEMDGWVLTGGEEKIMDGR